MADLTAVAGPTAAEAVPAAVEPAAVEPVAVVPAAVVAVLAAVADASSRTRKVFRQLPQLWPQPLRLLMLVCSLLMPDRERRSISSLL